ncbi:hypothetical protein AB0G35_00710 [Streptomyces sp. NPDC021749]|uniref:hypothetical protein n=1 Tax=Streptomyces sp. NPDC021749 TaxID=3154905 RepID=UPI00340CB326
MEAELVALATTGANALVQQMATEGWAGVRRRMAAFLARRRGAGDEAALEGELDDSRADLVAAQEEGDQDGVAGVTAAWRLRLRRLLNEDPAAAAELRALLDEVAPQEPDRGTVRVAHNTISGGSHGMAIQIGFVDGAPTFHTPPGGPLPG